MSNRSDWYKDIVSAARKRERALKMIAKWQQDLEAAEEAIKYLSEQKPAQEQE